MMDVAKGNIMSLFKTNSTKDCSKATHVQNVQGSVKKPRNLNI